MFIDWFLYLIPFIYITYLFFYKIMNTNKSYACQKSTCFKKPILQYKKNFRFSHVKNKTFTFNHLFSTSM